MPTIIEKIRSKVLELSASGKQWCIENKLLPGTNTYTKFVIVTSIRSGSTMLGSYLDNHRAMVCFFELFHRHPSSVPFGVQGYFARGKAHSVVHARNTDPVRFLEEQVYNRHAKHVKAVGFKLLYTQGRSSDPWWNGPEFDRWWSKVGKAPLLPNDKSDLWKYLQESSDIHIIHLVRRNYLEKTISAQKAIQSGNWGEGATGGVGKDVHIKVRINPQYLLEDMKAYERMELETDQCFANHPLIKVAYEELIQNPDDVLKGINTFLGLKHITLKTHTKKQNKQPICDTIENYEELSAFFRETKWKHLFE